MVVDEKWKKFVPIERRPALFDTPHYKLCRAFNCETFLESLTYQPKPGDVFIATYPKNGTTWMQMIVYLLQHDAVSPCDEEYYKTQTIFLEWAGKKTAESLVQPASIKAHMPANIIPWSEEAKYIVVIRNPKDSVVSYYFHVKGMDKFYDFADGTFDDFFDVWMSGEGEFGDYFDFVHSWLAKINCPNVFIITYEYMKANTREAVKKVAHFLDPQKYGAKVDADEEFVDEIIKNSSIKPMQDFFNSHSYGFASTQRDFKFVRKGVVNDWKNVMKEEQNCRLTARFKEEAKKSPLLMNIWPDYTWLDEKVN